MSRIVHSEEVWRDYASSKPFELQFRPVLKILDKIKPQGRCLDVGAGHGPLSIRIAERHPGLSVIALDSSPVMNELGRENVLSHNLEDRISYVYGSTEDTRLLNSLGLFDVIVSSFCLHYFDDPAATLSVLTGMLTPGGIIAMIDLDRVKWLSWIPIHGGILDAMRLSLSKREIRDFLQTAGIKHYRISSHFPFFLQLLKITAPFN